MAPSKKCIDNELKSAESEANLKVSSGSRPHKRVRTDFKRLIHNGVEKKRKDKINNSISRIKEVLPNVDPKKESKTAVLERCYEYIVRLKDANEKLLEGRVDEVQLSELNRCRKRVEELEAQNKKYLDLLDTAGIPPYVAPSDLWKEKPNKYSNKLTPEQVSHLLDKCSDTDSDNDAVCSPEAPKKKQKTSNDSSSSSSSDSENVAPPQPPSPQPTPTTVSCSPTTTTVTTAPSTAITLSASPSHTAEATSPPGARPMIVLNEPSVSVMSSDSEASRVTSGSQLQIRPTSNIQLISNGAIACDSNVANNVIPGQIIFSPVINTTQQQPTTFILANGQLMPVVNQTQPAPLLYTSGGGLVLTSSPQVNHVATLQANMTNTVAVRNSVSVRPTTTIEAVPVSPETIAKSGAKKPSKPKATEKSKTTKTKKDTKKKSKAKASPSNSKGDAHQGEKDARTENVKQDTVSTPTQGQGQRRSGPETEASDDILARATESIFSPETVAKGDDGTAADNRDKSQHSGSASTRITEETSVNEPPAENEPTSRQNVASNEENTSSNEASRGICKSGVVASSAPSDAVAAADEDAGHQDDAQPESVAAVTTASTTSTTEAEHDTELPLILGSLSEDNVISPESVNSVSNSNLSAFLSLSPAEQLSEFLSKEQSTSSSQAMSVTSQSLLSIASMIPAATSVAALPTSQTGTLVTSQAYVPTLNHRENDHAATNGQEIHKQFLPHSPYVNKDHVMNISSGTVVESSTPKEAAILERTRSHPLPTGTPTTSHRSSHSPPHAVVNQTDSQQLQNQRNPPQQSPSQQTPQNQENHSHKMHSIRQHFQTQVHQQQQQSAQQPQQQQPQTPQQQQQQQQKNNQAPKSLPHVYQQNTAQLQSVMQRQQPQNHQVSEQSHQTTGQQHSRQQRHTQQTQSSSSQPPITPTLQQTQSQQQQQQQQHQSDHSTRQEQHTPNIVAPFSAYSAEALLRQQPHSNHGYGNQNLMTLGGEHTPRYFAQSNTRVSSNRSSSYLAESLLSTSSSNSLETRTSKNIIHTGVQNYRDDPYNAICEPRIATLNIDQMVSQSQQNSHAQQQQQQQQHQHCESIQPTHHNTARQNHSHSQQPNRHIQSQQSHQQHQRQQQQHIQSQHQHPQQQHQPQSQQQQQQHQAHQQQQQQQPQSQQSQPQQTQHHHQQHQHQHQQQLSQQPQLHQQSQQQQQAQQQPHQQSTQQQQHGHSSHQARSVNTSTATTPHSFSYSSFTSNFAESEKSQRNAALFSGTSLVPQPPAAPIVPFSDSTFNYTDTLTSNQSNFLPSFAPSSSYQNSFVNSSRRSSNVFSSTSSTTSFSYTDPLNTCSSFTNSTLLPDSQIGNMQYPRSRISAASSESFSTCLTTTITPCTFPSSSLPSSTSLTTSTAVPTTKSYLFPGHTPGVGLHPGPPAGLFPPPPPTPHTFPPLLSNAGNSNFETNAFNSRVSLPTNHFSNNFFVETQLHNSTSAAAKKQSESSSRGTKNASSSTSSKTNNKKCSGKQSINQNQQRHHQTHQASTEGSRSQPQPPPPPPIPPPPAQPSSSSSSSSSRTNDTFSYLSVPEFINTSAQDIGSRSTLNHAAHVIPLHSPSGRNDSSYNLFRPQSQNSTLNFNFQPPTTNFGSFNTPTTTSTTTRVSSTANNSVSVNSNSSSHHVPNFNLSNIFPDIGNSHDNISLPAMKFPGTTNPILAPPPPPPTAAPTAAPVSQSQASSTASNTYAGSFGSHLQDSNQSHQGFYHHHSRIATTHHNHVPFNSFLPTPTAPHATSSHPPSTPNPTFDSRSRTNSNQLGSSMMSNSRMSGHPFSSGHHHAATHSSHFNHVLPSLNVPFGVHNH